VSGEVIGRRSLLLAGAALPASVSAYGQCVTDTMVVDACLGGVRRTVPQGMTLDLNFMSAPLDPRITFSRASTATFTDASGVIQTAAVNQPRWDYDPVTHAPRGLLIEEANGPRAQDICFISAANMVPWFASPGGTWFAEFDYSTNPLTNSRVIGQGGAVSGGGLTPLFMRDTNAGSQFDGALVDTATTTTITVVNKLVSTWAPGQAKVAMNGGPVVSSAGLVTGYGVLATFGIMIFTPAAPGSFDNLSGHIRRVKYWPRVLTNAEMQQVTT
jgi:hypothetical protein